MKQILIVLFLFSFVSFAHAGALTWNVGDRLTVAGGCATTEAITFVAKNKTVRDGDDCWSYGMFGVPVPNPVELLAPLSTYSDNVTVWRVRSLQVEEGEIFYILLSSDQTPGQDA